MNEISRFPLPGQTIGEHLQDDPIKTANQCAAQVVERLGTTNEELAHFLQTFADVADATRIGYGVSTDYTFVSYGSVNRHARFLENNATMYALLRVDMRDCRRPMVEDESYTVVNMRSGDELNFTYSDIERVRQGEYVHVAQDGGVSAINPEEVGAVAGIADRYESDDPILSLTTSVHDGAGKILEATLQTKEQFQRYGRLVSLDSPVCKNARVTLAPPTASELIAVLGYGSAESITPHVNRVTVPADTLPIVLDKETAYMLRSLVESVQHLDEDTQRAILRCVESIDVRGEEDKWRRISTIQSFISSSCTVENGAYAVTPVVELAKRLVCGRYDFTEAVYESVGGHFREAWSNKVDGGPTTRHVVSRLSEPHARMYAEVFNDRLMDAVEDARGPLGIPEDIPNVEQIAMLLHAHGYIEKGKRLATEERVMECRPEMTVPQWAGICMAIDRSRNGRMGQEERAALWQYGLNADAIDAYLQSGPGLGAEDIVVDTIDRDWHTARTQPSSDLRRFLRKIL